MLTELQIRALKPKAKPCRVADGDSLFVLVQPAGAKHWVYRYRVAGKETSISYGLYGEVSAAEARKRHRDARRVVQEGRSPAVDKRAAKARSRLDASQ